MKRAAFIVIAIVLTVLMYRMWLSDDGMRQVWRLSDSIEKQQAANLALRARNDALKAQVHDLRSGLDAIEELARTNLGMTHPSETFFQVVDTADASSNSL